MDSAIDELVETHRPDGDRKWSLQPLIRHAERSHSRMPGIKRIPLRAIGIIFFIALLNVVVWIAAAIVLVCLKYRSTCWSRELTLSSSTTIRTFILRTPRYFLLAVISSEITLLIFDPSGHWCLPLF